MDNVTRLVLEANGETTTLRKGQVVHVNGIPHELLADVGSFSATKMDLEAAANKTREDGDDG